MLKVKILQKEKKKKVISQCLSASLSDGDAQQGGPRFHFPANLEAVLWDEGECIDALSIGGTEFLGVDKLYFMHC